MTEKSATKSTEAPTADPATEVVAEALAAMQQDNLASSLAVVLKSAWDGTRFNVDGAVDAIAHADSHSP